MRTLRKCTVLLCMLQPTINISALVPPPDFGHGTPLITLYGTVYCWCVLVQIFECERMKFCDIPNRLHKLLQQPDPIVINHVIRCDSHIV